jgi:hypothetical protein
MFSKVEENEAREKMEQLYEKLRNRDRGEGEYHLEDLITFDEMPHLDAQGLYLIDPATREKVYAFPGVPDLELWKLEKHVFDRNEDMNKGVLLMDEIMIRNCQLTSTCQLNSHEMPLRAIHISQRLYTTCSLCLL